MVEVCQQRRSARPRMETRTKVAEYNMQGVNASSEAQHAGSKARSQTETRHQLLSNRVKLQQLTHHPTGLLPASARQMCDL